MEDNKISKPISINSLIFPNSENQETPVKEWKNITELNLKYLDVLSEIAYHIYDNKMFFKGKIRYKKTDDNNENFGELKLFKTESVNVGISAVNTNYGEIFSINRDGYVVDNSYLKNCNEEREINFDSFFLNV